MSSRCASRVMSPNAGRGNSSEGLSSHGDKTAAPKLGMRSHTTRLFWKYLLGTQCGWCANERVSSRPSLSYPLLPLSSLPSRPPPSPSQVRLPPSRRHVAISLGSIPGLHFFFFYSNISLPWCLVLFQGFVSPWTQLQFQMYIPPWTFHLISDLADSRGP